MSNTQEREAFEAYMRDEFGNEPPYSNLCWHIWQGARASLSAPTAAPGLLTDERIEQLLSAGGGRWNGSSWTIEDADLHPFVRTVVAEVRAAMSAPIVQSPMARWSWTPGAAFANQWPANPYADLARELMALSLKARGIA